MRDENSSRSGDDRRAAIDVAVSQIEPVESGLSGSGQIKTPWQKIRGGVLLGVGCVASPCCTPLIVPFVLTLLAGTPVAAFLAHYLGWVYGILTLISLLSLYFGARYLWQKPPSQREEEEPVDPVSRRASRQGQSWSHGC